eukprot:m.33241 g.33241  ORF g.33241 m.33241 type:complete len:662 (+) comp6438_c0_seq2:203-2188(+)
MIRVHLSRRSIFGGVAVVALLVIIGSISLYHQRVSPSSSHLTKMDSSQTSRELKEVKALAIEMGESSLTSNLESRIDSINSKLQRLLMLLETMEANSRMIVSEEEELFALQHKQLEAIRSSLSASSGKLGSDGEESNGLHRAEIHIQRELDIEGFIDKLKHAIAERISSDFLKLQDKWTEDGEVAKLYPETKKVDVNDDKEKAVYDGEGNIIPRRPKNWYDPYTMLDGQIRLPNTGICIDGYNPQRLISYFCDNKQPAQFFTYTDSMQIETDDGNGKRCIDATGVNATEHMRVDPCDATREGQTFVFEAGNTHQWNVLGRLRLKKTSLCLTSADLLSNDFVSVTLERCGQYKCRQSFIFNAFSGTGKRTVREIEQKKMKPHAAFTHESFGGAGGRIFCWIMTNPKNHATKAKTVRDTWGRQCDKLVFVTTKPSEDFDTWLVPLPGQESRNSLWKKSQYAWMKTYEEELANFNWFIRGDDDTYMMFDNLRTFLQDKNPNELLTYGRLLLGRYEDEVIPFYSGGPGTVLSRGTLKRLGDAVTQNKKDMAELGGEDVEPIFNTWDTFADDMELGVSLARVGVELKEALDDEGRNLFMTLGVEAERMVRKADDPDFWYWTYCPTAKEGKACCSNRWIGTHYVRPEDMKSLEDLHQTGCEAAGFDP